MPPGKMYSRMKSLERRYLSNAASSMVIAWRQARPPGFRQSRSLRKYAGHQRSPTASIISMETMRSYCPSRSR